MLLRDGVYQVGIVPTQQIINSVDDANAHLKCVAWFLDRNNTEFQEFCRNPPRLLIDCQIAQLSDEAQTFRLAYKGPAANSSSVAAEAHTAK